MDIIIPIELASLSKYSRLPVTFINFALPQGGYFNPESSFSPQPSFPIRVAETYFIAKHFF